MTMAETESAAATKKGGFVPVLMGVLLALALGGGAFYAVYSGMLLAPEHDQSGKVDEAAPATAGQAVFVPIDPIVVSLGSPGRGRHLRFRAELDVEPGAQDTIVGLMPRILDVLNGYLRAVPVEELERPAALVLLRAQMLRRVQLVVGDGLVRDLLVTEFVLN